MSNEITDTDRLDWLERHEANLVTHREQMSEGCLIWWNVAKRNKSLSGHPLGSCREAIDFAIEQSGEKFHSNKHDEQKCAYLVSEGRLPCSCTGARY